MDDNDKKRNAVSQDYAKAVGSPGKGCCGAPVQKGVAAKLAGYSAVELGALPEEAVVNSFGCGNPLAFSGVKPGDVVLDLGSGAGIDLLIAAKKVGAKGSVIGVDMTDAMIAKAKQNIAAARVDNIDVRKGIIEDLPVESGSVDWVISNCVINLSPEKARVFAEIARVLRPGGAMLVSDIVADALPKELVENRALYSSCVAGAISERDYLAGLRDAGLTEVSVKERVVYDTAQLEAFAGSEVQELGGCGCGSASMDALIKEWAPRLQGHVASIKVFARKPVAHSG